MPKDLAIPIIEIETIQERIYIICGRKIMIDRDLALLYGVPTKALNQAVKRNLSRFPYYFMFVLSKEEMEKNNDVNFKKIFLKPTFYNL